MTQADVPDSLRKHPRLGQWLQPGADGRIRATSGKVDIGQGISHALRLIVAEELQVAPEQVHMVRPTTIASPDEAVTSGSLSVQHSGAALRLAAAHLREACRQRAALRAGVPPESVLMAEGCFMAGAERLQYAELFDAVLLDEAVDPQHLARRDGRASAFGESPRTDISQKVFGEFEYLHDMRLPGMVWGRIFTPPTPLGRLDETAWAELEPRLRGIAGVVEVVRDGQLVGVLAEAAHPLEECSKQVMRIAPWHGEVDVPAPADTARWLRSQPLDTATILDRQPTEAPWPVARVFQAEYGRGWLHHASIGLCCAIAQWEHHTTGETLQVWSHTQGIFNLRRDLALAFGIGEASVRVCHADAAGCYGHNGADDVAFDAAWLARHAQGRPVRLEWTREQEMTRSPMAPAMTVEIEAGIDERGRITRWHQSIFSQGHGTRPGRGATPALTGAWQTAQPTPVTMAINMPPPTGGGADRNGVPPYAFESVQVHSHRVLAMPLRVSAMRALGAHVNVMSAESMMDEIARALGQDPLAFRLAHLDDARGRVVLEEAARLCEAAGPRPAIEGFGRGIGYARYKNTGAWCAVVADVVVQERVKLRNLWMAADLGLVVHPDGTRNQLEGGALQAASWTLHEAARLSPQGIESRDWESYPIFGFSDMPPVTISLIDRPDSPSLGAGECSCGPTAAAIANAIEDALGLRMRTMPFTADAIMQAAQDAV